MGFVYRRCADAPNDPKLSDRSLGAPVCARRREAQARAVPGFMAGAQAVTEPVKCTAARRKLNARAAVRCSAWLGVTLLGESAQTTTGQKGASALRMKSRADQNRRHVEPGETAENGRLGLAEDTGLRLTKPCVSG